MDSLKLFFALLIPFGLNAKDTAMDSLDRDTNDNLDQAVPEWWAEDLLEDSVKNAFFNDSMMGAMGSGKPIIRKDDYMAKKSGDIIRLNVSKKLFGAGVTGENKLAGQEDKFSLGQFTFTVSRKRNAVAFTDEISREVNFEVAGHVKNLLSDWEARRRDDVIMNELINGATSPRNIYGGDATTVDGLNDGDQLGVTEIDKAKLTLQRLGAEPIETPYGYMYALIIDECSEYRLKGDNSWNQAQRDAAPRDYKENVLWQGRMGKMGKVLGIWNGVCVYVLNSIRSGATIRGSYIRPEAILTSAYTTGGVTLTITGSSDIDADKYFPSSGKVTITDGTNTDEVAYSATTDSTITITSTSSNSYAVGSLVTYYESVARCVAFGAEAVAYGYGQKPKMITHEEDYGMVQGIGVDCVDGAKLIEDSNSAVPNVVLLNVKAANPTTV